MDANELALAETIRKDTCFCLQKYLPRIVSCLQQLSEEDICWRPNHASNAVGNIVLHLCGSIRQWIISGLGGAPDIREREKEFAEHGPTPRLMLIKQLETTVGEAREIIEGLSAETLLNTFNIQGYTVSGLTALLNVHEHFAYHAGQIIYFTKFRCGIDLNFTRLPGQKPNANLRPRANE